MKARTGTFFRLGLGLLVMTANLGACGRRASESGDEGAPGTPQGGGGGGGGMNGGSIPDQMQPCAKMDIIFVVDDSGSMAEEQDNLATNFPRFVSVLNEFKNGAGKPLDYRLAVTTTGRDLKYKISLPPPVSLELPFNEKGDNGAFRQKAACSMNRRWIERNDANADKTFSCAAKVGTGGPSIEMPLYALQLALNDRVADGTNAGFVRHDALLAAVILSDEDDCSREDNNFSVLTDQCDNSPQVQPVSKYLDMLDKAKQGRGRWAAAVIAGERACKSQFGDALEAKRLKDFVSKTGKNGVFSSICAGDLTQALRDALNTFTGACEGFYIPG